MNANAPSPKGSTTQWINASRTILFAAQSIQTAFRRCMAQEHTSNLLSPSLQKLTSTIDTLALALDRIDALAARQTPMPTVCAELVRATSACVAALKQLTAFLCSKSIVPLLDQKLTRYILLSVHGATVDVKEAWGILTSALSHPGTISSSTPTSVCLSPVNMTNRSPSDRLASPLTSPLTSPSGDDADRPSQRYNHLRLAVAGSLQVIHLLKQAIQDALATGDLSASLEKRLRDFSQQSDATADTALCLEKSIASAKDDPRDRSRVREDTNRYLEAMVSLMSDVRAISTKEDFVWPKAVKQGCLQMTRVTAEIAKVSLSKDSSSASGSNTEPMRRSMSSGQSSHFELEEFDK